MDTEDLRFRLENEAKFLMDLAKRLTDKGGKPLEHHERAAIRRALSGSLEEMQYEQYVAYLRGDEDHMEKVSDRILELLSPPILA